MQFEVYDSMAIVLIWDNNCGGGAACKRLHSSQVRNDGGNSLQKVPKTHSGLTPNDPYTLPLWRKFEPTQACTEAA